MNKIKAWLRKALPRSIICGLGLIYTYLHLRSQAKTNKEGFCVDRKNEYQPWLTYSCIDFLKTLNLKEISVFEFGSGASTLFWKQNGSSTIVSVEKDEGWFKKINNLLSSLSDVKIVLKTHDEDYANSISEYGNFDIILIDGACRKRCAQNSINKLNKGGFIILDNADWYPNTCTLLRNAGFQQIDFFGFTPINSFMACTSIFFKDEIKFTYKKNLPVYGKTVTVIDD